VRHGEACVTDDLQLRACPVTSADFFPGFILVSRDHKVVYYRISSMFGSLCFGDSASGAAVHNATKAADGARCGLLA
jgi:hypothetical protein